jgi:hypothetical protein
MSNPLNLTTEYTWQAGDCFSTVAIKYRRQVKDYLHLLELNKDLVRKNNYIMRPGDVIKVPEDWFPLREVSFGTKIIGSKGIRI